MKTHVLHELKEHLPFTLLSAGIGIVLLGLWVTLKPPIANESLFHFFHPAHVLFSAITTTAMFSRYNKNIAKAMLFGVIGSIAIGSLSDIVIPYIGGILVGAKMLFHLDVIEHPLYVIPSALAGVLIGLLLPSRRMISTIFPHSIHILISTMATLFYLVSFGFTNWEGQLIAFFIIIVLGVFIPCCTSDIVFPVWAGAKVEHHDG